ncbi:MAG: hypothetical protein HPY53_00575 [Brevinematales bacterium]|nr:hypothetical protein [Brevinematales bacterium]
MKSNFSKYLIWGGIVYTFILIMWPVFMFMGTGGAIEQQLAFISLHPSIHMLGFFFAFLIAPAFGFIMIITLESIADKNRALYNFSLIFFAIYATMVTVSYTAQFALVPGLLKTGNTQLAAQWYFNTPGSIAGFFNQMGYTILIIPMMIWSIELLKQKGVLKVSAILLILSSTLQLGAFAGLITDNSTLSFLTLPSGIMVLPLGVLSTLYGIKLNRIAMAVSLQRDKLNRTLSH